MTNNRRVSPGPTVPRLAVELAAFAVIAWIVSVHAAWAKRSNLTAIPLVAVESGAVFPDDLPHEPVPSVAAAPERALPEPAPEPVIEAIETEDQDADVITPPAGFERYYNGRPVRVAKTIKMVVTAYSPDWRSCGDSADGITATNHSVWTNAMCLVAADKRLLPMGSLVSVPGYANGEVVPVLDVGGAIKGKRLDVLFPTHSIARKWGKRTLTVTVWEYAD